MQDIEKENVILCCVGKIIQKVLCCVCSEVAESFISQLFLTVLKETFQRNICKV